MLPNRAVVIALLLVLFCAVAQAQQTAASNTNVTVPPLVKFSGVLTDLNGRPLNDVVGVTFCLYKDQQGGAPLWLETQNVHPDKAGRYAVMLGSTSSSGLPADLFASGEARWLGVQVQGQMEQPRVLLLSVPYALKAGDAQTLGGLPASAFVLAAPSTGAPTATSSSSASPNATVPPQAPSDVTTSGGTVATLPLFATATSIQNSLVTQTGTSAINVGGKLNLFATGTATAAGGKNSHPLNMSASAFNTTTNASASQTFQWLVEPSANATPTPSGALHLLFGSGPSPPAETGLSIANNGQITFAPGQTFSATNSASSFGVAVTGTTTGTGLGDYGVEGIATATSGLAAGVYGSGASPSGFGVVGTSSANVGVYGSTNGTTSTSYGVEGYVNALVGPGVGVYGSGGANSAAIGVEGVSSTVGVLGSASGTGYGVKGTSANVAVFGNASGASGIGVDGHGFIGIKGIATAAGGYSGSFGGGPVSVAGKGNNTLIGDAGCGSGYAGIGFTTGSLSNCTNYALLGDTKGNTFINSNGGTAIHFRDNNNGKGASDLVTMNGNGNMSVTGNVSVTGVMSVGGTFHSGNIFTSVSASNIANASTGTCQAILSAPDARCQTPNMSLTMASTGGPVLVMANIGTVVTTSCVIANFYLVMDKAFIGGAVVMLAPAVGAYSATPVTIMSLQFPAAGEHTFQVQATDDQQFLCGDYLPTTVSGQSDVFSQTAPRTLIVREF